MHLKTLGRNPKALCFDWGKEFINQDLWNWCAEQGIEIQTTAPYSPSNTGVAEHMNWTLVELAHAMINTHDLPEFLWEQAVAHTAYLRNWAFTSPHTLWKLAIKSQISLIFVNLVSGLYTKDRLNNENDNQNQCDEPMLATTMALILFFITAQTPEKFYPHRISVFSPKQQLHQPPMTLNSIQHLKGRKGTEHPYKLQINWMKMENTKPKKTLYKKQEGNKSTFEL